MGHPLGSNGAILSGFPTGPERCLICEWDSPELNDGVCPNCANPANYVNPPGWLSDYDNSFPQNSFVPTSVTTDTNYSFASRQHTVFTPHSGNADSTAPSSSGDRSERRVIFSFCDVCVPPKSFTTINDRDRHLRVRHDMVPAGHQGWMCKVPDCPAAAKFWTRPDNFKQHVIRIHGKALGEECLDWTVAFRPGEMVTTLAASESRREHAVMLSSQRSTTESRLGVNTSAANDPRSGINGPVSLQPLSVFDHSQCLQPQLSTSGSIPHENLSRSPRRDDTVPSWIPPATTVHIDTDTETKTEPERTLTSPHPTPYADPAFTKEPHSDPTTDNDHPSAKLTQPQQDHPISGLENVLSSLEERIGNTYGDVSTTSTLVQGNITIHLTKNITNNYVWDGRKSAFYDDRDCGKRRGRSNST